MPNRNVVSWSAMIVGYVQSGHPTEALALFRQMQLTNVKTNSVTMVSVVPTYSCLAALRQDFTPTV
jgi:pentatricopeptide repeat protein